MDKIGESSPKDEIQKGRMVLHLATRHRRSSLRAPEGIMAQDVRWKSLGVAIGLGILNYRWRRLTGAVGRMTLGGIPPISVTTVTSTYTICKKGQFR